jgi:hypothetical protein
MPAPSKARGSLRALWQADRPHRRASRARNRLPGANSFADTAKVLKATRASCVVGTPATLSPATTPR